MASVHQKHPFARVISSKLSDLFEFSDWSFI
jgi:hypothetical protein